MLTGVTKDVAEKMLKALLKGIESSVVKGEKVSFLVSIPGGKQGRCGEGWRTNARALTRGRTSANRTLMTHQRRASSRSTKFVFCGFLFVGFSMHGGKSNNNKIKPSRTVVLCTHLYAHGGRRCVKMKARSMGDWMRMGILYRPGFGAWEQVTRRARNGRNIQTGKSVTYPPSKGVKFKAGLIALQSNVLGCSPIVYVSCRRLATRPNFLAVSL